MEVVARDRKALSEADLLAHQAWYPCEGPGDVDRLEAWGLPREGLLAALSGFEDWGAMFALPPEAGDAGDPRMLLAASVRTAGGYDHVGYLHGPVAGLFFCGSDFGFDPAFPQGLAATAAELNHELRSPILPLTVTLTATGERVIFDGT